MGVSLREKQIFMWFLHRTHSYDHHQKGCTIGLVRILLFVILDDFRSHFYHGCFVSETPKFLLGGLLRLCKIYQENHLLAYYLPLPATYYLAYASTLSSSGQSIAALDMYNTSEVCMSRVHVLCYL